MNQREKDVIWVLNCMRLHPSLFLKTVVSYWDYPPRYKSVREKKEYKSLIPYFKNLEPIGMVYPDSLIHMSARTRAEEYPSHRGHNRTTQRAIDNKCNCRELISYNSFESIDIVMDLLVDINSANYQNRRYLTSPDYLKVGTAIRKQNPGFFISVIDFR